MPNQLREALRKWKNAHRLEFDGEEAEPEKEQSVLTPVCPGCVKDLVEKMKTQDMKLADE